MDSQYKKDLWKEFELDDAVEFDTETLSELPVAPVNQWRRFKETLQRGLRRSASDRGVTKKPPSSPHSLPSFSSASSPRNPLTRGYSHVVDVSGHSPAISAAQVASKPGQMPVNLPGRDGSTNIGHGRGAKRKREQPIVLQPESRQFFKGFIFFFIQNNDINPIRRIQIRKAIEYGAIWAQEWRDGITHIVADSYLTYHDVVSWVTKNCVNPIPNAIILVKNNWPGDCIHYGFKIDPKQSAYYVKGYTPPEPIPDDTSKPATKSAISSKDKDASPDHATVNHEASVSANDAAYGRIETETQHILDDCDTDQTQQSSLPIATNNFDDDLSKAIKEAQATKDLPLDSDDDKEPTPSPETSSEDDSSNEQREKPRQPRKKSFTAKPGQSGFVCMSGNDGSGKSVNPNAHTIDILQQMADIYDRLKDQWRTLAYRRAISQLKKQTEKIVTKEQAEQLPFVGERLALKIQEIATTNRLRRLENARLEPDEQVIKLFLGVYGVGTSQAYSWFRQGCRTLQDLTNGTVSLTRNQQIGIEHYDDFNARIPRSEMTQHDDFVRRFASKLDPELQLTIGGSFRRGASESGDIDFIVTKPGASASTVKTIMLDRVIHYLLKADYLKVALAASHHGKDGGSKWHGACVLPQPKGSSEPSLPWRRIDFLFVPWAEIGAALLYFTGNDIFNRSIRLLAGKKHMRLNQHGLYKDVMRGPGRKRLTEGTLVERHNERRIFIALDVPWREPWERIC